MKQKFIFKTNDTEKVIYLKKQGHSYIALYNGEQYSPALNGTKVTFNGQERFVDNRVIYFDVEGTKFITFFNKYAGAIITPENGVKVKSNKIGNNFAAGFSLFIIFVVILIVMFICSIVVF